MRHLLKYGMDLSDRHDMLVCIDVQNGFIPGGNLPVPHGEEVVPVINRLAKSFRNVILTQDWHPAGHASFASSHPGRKPFEAIRLSYGDQVLWPDHCIQDSRDAAIHPDLDVPHAQLVLRKGYHREVDSYSAFYAADHVTATGLAGYLRERGMRRLFFVGLATDYCVAWSALDARREGFEAFVVEDACRAIDLEGSLARAWADMEAAGVIRLASAEILGKA